ncbi:hypothetical protein HK097_004060 [Rhizophlyctis rosea]|uniref:Matrin-type domain-containing protein n=1 Tax=Rhizophlyctis rosea TaxID=64517 RepID=A0AAD5SR72_9FUNG|nr:hypothetical protein HK097_004060 [Rhizophlyctis rosea]
MAERWVSNKKYLCKYCQIYLQDNKASRNIHEQGRKHKDAVEAFLAGVHKRSEAKQKEDMETKAMLQKIEEAAAKQFASDTGSLYRKSASAIPTAATTAYTPSFTPAFTPTAVPHFTPKFEPKALPAEESTEGGSDPYGGWTVVDTPLPPTSAATGMEAETKAVDEYEEEPEENLRGFKIREKILPTDSSGGIGDEDDSGSTATFKKRKMGAGKVNRNIRKRTE